MDADVQRYSDIHMDQNIHSDADGHGYGIVNTPTYTPSITIDIYTHAVRHGKPHIYGNRDIYAHLHADMHVKLDAYTDTHVDPVRLLDTVSSNTRPPRRHGQIPLHIRPQIPASPTQTYTATAEQHAD